MQMYSDVVLGIEISHFEKHLERAKEKRGVKQDGRFQGVSGFIWTDPKALADGLKYPSQLTMQAFRRGLRVAR